MKLSSSNLALATLALSPNLLSSPVFAAPTPDVGGFSPNPSTGYFADSPQPRAVDSPLLQGTPTFSGPPTLTGTPPTSKVAGKRRSIRRRSSARFRAVEPTPGSPGLGLGLGIGLFGSSVHLRAASPLDLGGASEGLPASATSAATSTTPALVKPEGSLDDPNPRPSFPGVVPIWLDPQDTLPENLLGDPSYPLAGRDVGTTEYPYPQHDARDARFPLTVEGLESPFLNSPVPHDSPTFPPAIHKRQSMSIPVVGGSPLVGSVSGVVPGAVPLTGLPLALGPNGLPISAPNLDSLPLPNLGGTGLLPSASPLGIVSSLPGTTGISAPGVPNVNGLPLVGGVGTMVSGVSNGLGLGGLPLSGVPSQLGTVDQVLRPITYPLTVLDENPHAAHGLADPASKLLSGLNPNPQHLQETGAGVVGSGLGGLVQEVEGMAPGIGAVTPVAGLLPVPGAGLPGVNIPSVVPGVDLPGSLPGLGLLPSAGALPVPSAGTLPISGSVPQFVPTTDPLNQAAAVPGVLPNPLGAVHGVASIPTGVLGGVAGVAPGLIPGVRTLPVSVPVPVPGVDSLPVHGADSLPVSPPGQLGSATAPLTAIPGSLGPVSKGEGVPVVSKVVGASGAIPGLVGAAPVSVPGLIPTSVSAPSLMPASVPMPLPTGTPLPGLLPKKGDLGVPVVGSPSPVTDEVVGIYKATGGMGTMGRPDEKAQVNGWKDGNGTGKDEKEVEAKEKDVDKKDGQGEKGVTTEASSATVRAAEASHTLPATHSGTHSSATPTVAASQAPSETMPWPKDGTPAKSASAAESPSTRSQMVKQATPMPVAESLMARAGLGRRAPPVPDVVPTLFSIGVPPAHSTAAPLSVATAVAPAPPSPLDDGPVLPTITVTESVLPTPMYHGGSPLSRVPEIVPVRLTPPTDATKAMMDAPSSVSGAANPTETLRRVVGLPKMATSVMRAATAVASAPTQGQTN